MGFGRGTRSEKSRERPETKGGKMKTNTQLVDDPNEHLWDAGRHKKREWPMVEHVLTSSRKQHEKQTHHRAVKLQSKVHHRASASVTDGANW